MTMSKTQLVLFIFISFSIVSSITFLVIDIDNDELITLSEIEYGTSFIKSDTDGDLLPDGEEILTYDTDPLQKDSDNDGLNDNVEINKYSSNPLDADCDNDGLNDGEEVSIGSSIFDDDSDNDGYKDGSDDHPTTHEWKLMDSDNDGWNDYKEYYDEGTDRYDSDTDDDGYEDSADSHPTTHEWKLMDSDDDGWDDYKEYYDEGTDRFDSDTDGDGVIDSRDANPLSSASVFTRIYEWDYPYDWWNRQTWTWTLQIPKDLYNYLQNLQRLNQESWSEYTVDPLITNLANGLKEAAEGENYDEYQTVSYILSFVQSLPYTSDDVTTGYDEYPRYPTETLVDGGGDCEDTSFLFAGIMRELNYGVCLIELQGHLAVGVLGEESIAGVYYEWDGKRYYYCETTGDGFSIGDCPDEYINESAQLIKIN